MNAILVGGLVVLAVNVLLCAVRGLRGPTLFDRVVALDCLSFNLAGAIVIVSLLFDSAIYLDVVLVLALIGFLAPVTLAAYLEGTLVD